LHDKEGFVARKSPWKGQKAGYTSPKKLSQPSLEPNLLSLYNQASLLGYIHYYPFNSIFLTEILMRLGLMLGYSGAKLDLPLEMIQEADRLGVHVVWTAEAYGSDAATPLAWIAAQTENVRIGTAIMQMQGRTPANTAMTAMTLDQLSEDAFSWDLAFQARRLLRDGMACLTRARYWALPVNM
jgi:hypothetical protein